ncbi:predicted protein [Naegleria gruberi]|uniref:Predicted protein n=1 Tax=Naegleria gruberi TaxID=5762 RepID=D2VIT7_NAEGR|nr:uncharacterized protein NAEGRDRAFT_49890 [Naegleria gruberi]EFC43409.1 predicted protein [Naegleria gruberi]|eukprot:XP_002676153.1 predicted protein [Naegleria gruberi strain NEG-M]
MRRTPTSPSRVILSQHYLNPFYFDFTKNHCNCCPHDDPLLILFQCYGSSSSSACLLTKHSNHSIHHNTAVCTSNTINAFDGKKKRNLMIEEYRKLIDEAIIQYERLEIESALGCLKQATCKYSKEEEKHFLAPLLYAQILGDTIHDETLRNELLSPCRERLKEALHYIEIARDYLKQMKLVALSYQNSKENHQEEGTVIHFSPLKVQQQTQESILKRIELWIDSVEYYICGNFEEMKKTSSKGIALGEEVYSKLNCSRHHHRTNTRNHSSTLNHSQHSHLDFVSLRKMKDHNQQHIFQHNFEKDINFIYQHHRDVTMGELWRLQYIASNCQQVSTETVPPDQLRMQYRYLCKSMAFGNLIPSRVLCQIALVCHTLEQLTNTSSSVSNYHPQQPNCTSSDEELMLRAKIHDLVFHDSGGHTLKKMNQISLKSLKEANIFAKIKSPREVINLSNKRISLPEQYFQDSFLLNGRGSFCGSIECALGESNLVANNLTKVMRLFPVEGKFNPVLLSILGYCLYKDGEDKRSETLFSRAISLHPNNFSIFKSMNEKFYLLCYRFFLLSEEKFVEQVEVLFKRILNMAMERATSDRLIYLVRGQQRCFLSLIPNYYDNSIDIELKEDEVQRTIESLDYYSYLSNEEQIDGLTCKYTKRMRENLFRFCSDSNQDITCKFTDLTCFCK